MTRGGTFAAVTTGGLHRPGNEDAVAVPGALLTGEVIAPYAGHWDDALTQAFVVADGVGSRPHGARASREAAKVAADLAAAGCVQAVIGANLRLHEVMLAEPETCGMATALAGVAMSAGSACWFNVGDCRVYHLGGARLRQLSTDDTQPCPGFAGAVSHVLSHSLGGQRAVAPVQPHAGRLAMLAGERLLLCSDGLWNMVPDPAIAAILGGYNSVADAVAALLASALEGGGRDNISVVLIRT